MFEIIPGINTTTKTFFSVYDRQTNSVISERNAFLSFVARNLDQFSDHELCKLPPSLRNLLTKEHLTPSQRARVDRISTIVNDNYLRDALDVPADYRRVGQDIVYDPRLNDLYLIPHSQVQQEMDSVNSLKAGLQEIINNTPADYLECDAAREAQIQMCQREILKCDAYLNALQERLLNPVLLPPTEPTPIAPTGKLKSERRLIFD